MKGGDHLEDFFSSLPPGIRFALTDDELVSSYLIKKVLNQTLPPNRILEINVYEHNPDKLHEMGKNYGDKYRYYFTTRKRGSGDRPDRAAGTGFWKASTKKEVLDGKKQVGTKRTLVFHQGKHKEAKKTNWLMQEFTLFDHVSPPRQCADKDQLDLVLCKIYYNDTKGDKDTTDRKRKYGDEEPIAAESKNENGGGEDFLTDYQIEHIDTSDYMDDQKQENWLQKEDVFVQVEPEKKNGDDQAIVSDETDIWFNVEDILFPTSEDDSVFDPLHMEYNLSKKTP